MSLFYPKDIRKTFLENYRICRKSENDTNTKEWRGKGGVGEVQVLGIIMTQSVCEINTLNRNKQIFSLEGIHDITNNFEIKNSDGVQN